MFVWLKKAMLENGEPSSARLVMLLGIGIPLLLGTVAFFLNATGLVPYERVEGVLDWFKNYVVAVIPYVVNKLSGMFGRSETGIAPDGFGQR